MLALVTQIAAGATAQADGATVTLSITRFGQVHRIDAGDYFGASPGVVRVKVGDRVTFVNEDAKHHTATGIVGARSFVPDPHWTDAALGAAGAIGGGAWSTGDLAPGKSATVMTAKPGTYLWGCFFEYSAGMRGEIVVEP